MLPSELLAFEDAETRWILETSRPGGRTSAGNTVDGDDIDHAVIRRVVERSGEFDGEWRLGRGNARHSASFILKNRPESRVLWVLGQVHPQS
jgi:hypothetical protein